MPITANYTWTEKKDTIKVAVPLKGVSANKADVLGMFIFHYFFNLTYSLLFF